MGRACIVQARHSGCARSSRSASPLAVAAAPDAMALPAHLQRYDRLIDVLVELLVSEAAGELPESKMPQGPATESVRHQESNGAESAPSQ
jgi:hypothetical protein